MSGFAKGFGLRARVSRQIGGAGARGTSALVENLVQLPKDRAELTVIEFRNRLFAKLGPTITHFTPRRICE